MYNKRVRYRAGPLKRIIVLCGIISLAKLEARSGARPLSGCLISLLSQAESSNPRRRGISGLVGIFRGIETRFDDTLIKDKIYTSMISYYIENESAFGFYDAEGVPKNFLDLSIDEHSQIKEAMAKDVEESDEGTAHIRKNVATLIRTYTVPINYRDYQRTRSRSN